MVPAFVGVDSKGDIYAGLTQDRSVDKHVRIGQGAALLSPGSSASRRYYSASAPKAYCRCR